MAADVDDIAIRNLLARVARMSDTGTVDEYVELFTDDAVLAVTGAPTRQGSAQMRAGTLALREAGATGPGSGTMHVLGTSEIAVDGDKAAAHTPFTFYRTVDGAAVLAGAGRYYDELVRTTSGWRLHHRRIAIGAGA
ncbi:MAG: nuclear transport factor 2 family protein [Frankia sp.]|nr:nuclear transport factor 2 family protein [Frankia sp.]